MRSGASPSDASAGQRPAPNNSRACGVRGAAGRVRRTARCGQGRGPRLSIATAKPRLPSNPDMGYWPWGHVHHGCTRDSASVEQRACCLDGAAFNRIRKLRNRNRDWRVKQPMQPPRRHQARTLPGTDWPVWVGTLALVLALVAGLLLPLPAQVGRSHRVRSLASPHPLLRAWGATLRPLAPIPTFAPRAHSWAGQHRVRIRPPTAPHSVLRGEFLA